MIRIGAVLIAFLFLSGCSSDAEMETESGGSPEVELEGRAFTGEPVTGRELVPGSLLTVTFEDGRVGLSAACNNMSASYELADGRLELTTDMVSTMMGCPKPLERQDQWLTEFFGSAPTVSETDDGNVSLKGEAIEIVLTPQ